MQSNSSTSGYVLLVGFSLLFIMLLVIFNLYRINQINKRKHTILDLQEFVHLDDNLKSTYKKIIVEKIMPLIMNATNDSFKNIIQYYKKNEEDILKIFENYLKIAKLSYMDTKNSTIIDFNKDQRLILNQLNLKTILSDSCRHLNIAKRMYDNTNGNKSELEKITCS